MERYRRGFGLTLQSIRRICSWAAAATVSKEIEKCAVICNIMGWHQALEAYLTVLQSTVDASPHLSISD